MAELVLFHHAQGLTDGCRALAEDLRAAGHTVHAPDLYDGRTFPTLTEGLGHAERIGFGTVIGRGHAAAEGLPDHDPEAAALVLERALGCLERIDAGRR